MKKVVLLLLFLVSVPAFAQKLTHQDSRDTKPYKLRIYHYNKLSKVLQDVEAFLILQQEIRIEKMSTLFPLDNYSVLEFIAYSVSDSVLCDCLPTSYYGGGSKEDRWRRNQLIKNDGENNRINGGLNFADYGDFVEIHCYFSIVSNLKASEEEGDKKYTSCYMINIKNHLFDYLLKRYPEKKSKLY